MENTGTSPLEVANPSNKTSLETPDLSLEVLNKTQQLIDLGSPSKSPSPNYVCQISILKKELGLNENLLGMTGLCICDTKISIINYPFKSKEQNSIDIMMPSIIGVGVEGTFFYIFLKDDSPLGYGQLWVETYDTKISVKLFDIIHETLISNNNRVELLKTIESDDDSIQNQRYLVRKYKNHAFKYMKD
ncbi:hypothetical protein AGLY_017836 [Aphis glycines]|uniref:Uncharacterized protein n=1 Tax=Aphis glycines TaxID=307491 RepID=A0A6G0STX4_APHGL|nr:hypothetical protein AGLY_017836 [Aphis glycines]